jgi:hypothetical protein
MTGEFLSNRNLAISVALVAGLGGCATAEQAKPVQTTAAETTVAPSTKSSYATSPGENKPKITCPAYEVEDWRAIPPHLSQGLDRVLKVSEERARNGKFGNVICSQELDRIEDLGRPVNAVGVGEDCAIMYIEKQESPIQGTVGQGTVAACPEPLK